MSNRKGGRNAYYFFVLEKLPELKRRGLNVTGVADAIPHCSGDWAMLTEEQKEKYADKARLWKAKKLEAGTKPSPGQALAPCPVQTQRVPIESLSNTSRKCDQVTLKNVFYILNIFSHGELPPHCIQRFLPCEIGCVKYSLKDGIIADFHLFIDSGAVPRGFRFHCQAAGDATHRIPISGFELASASCSVGFRDLCMFIQPHRNHSPLVYCKSDDHFRVSWCLKHMAAEAGTTNQLKILNVEDLVVELYQRKFQKEPSKTWVHNTLDASMWDYSSNTRCKWHEENDILFCALATCKKIAYGISNSLADLCGIPVTSSHLPVCDKDCQSTVNPKMVVLDAGRYQRARAQHWGKDRYFASVNQDKDAILCTGSPSSPTPHMLQPVELQEKEREGGESIEKAMHNTGTANLCGVISSEANSRGEAVYLEHRECPSGVKTVNKMSIGRGRGVVRFLESISKQPVTGKLQMLPVLNSSE